MATDSQHGRPVQLSLGIKLRDEATFANFFAGPNAAVLAAVEAIADPSAKADLSYLYLWGPTGSGRSHLLQAACHRAAEAQALAMYLPLGEARLHGPAILDGMEGFDLLCLDDLDSIAGDAAWEEALFHLYNRLRDQGGRLLIAAAAAPRALEVGLADLSSRLGSGLVYQLTQLSDEEKQRMLQLRAELRGLQLPDEVARYILSHGARDMSALFDALEQLDQASLEARHRLTIPFVKRVMSW